jgi:hypothetical protein
VEQLFIVKFWVKLGKSAAEMYEFLKKFYGDYRLLRSQVLESFKRLKREWRSSETISDSIVPSITRNIEKVGEIFRQNSCLRIRAVSELINIGKETIRQNMKERCSKMVLRLLAFEQKKIRMNISANILHYSEDELIFLEIVITCDETRGIQIDPESKGSGAE